MPLVTQGRIMIQSFGSKETEEIWNGVVSTKLPIEIQNIARRKLRMINNSISINDLRVPPANRLEKLKGDKEGMFSIRINDQWRIIFDYKNSHAYNVTIADYH